MTRSDPSAPRSAASRRTGPLPTRVVVSAVATIAAASVWLRWPGFSQGRIANHDVAGILYNAMLLEAGRLPYVDSLELKAPGTFFLASWLAGPEGRDIARFQIWANACGVASLLAVGGFAGRLWGARSALVAMVLYGVHDAHLDTMDANYVTWAQLPMVVSAWLAYEGTRARSLRAPWYLAAGAGAGASALCKRPVGMIAIAIVLSIAASRRSLGGGPSPPTRLDRARAVGWALLGMGAIHLPLVIRYARAGSLGALLEGYLLNPRGFAYVGHGFSTLAADAPGSGLAALGHFLPWPVALATVAALAAPASDRSVRSLLVGWTAVALASASLGFRFYKGYFLAASVPLCLLAAAPWGLTGPRWPAGRTWRLVLVLPTLVLGLRQANLLRDTRSDRARPHDLGGRRIADHVAANSPPGSTVWVWGWHLWDVYPYTGMLSPARMYKSWGFITTGNDSTWRRPPSPMHFVDNDHARRLLDELRDGKPHYVVLGSAVPHQEFDALHRWLRRDYVRDRRVRLGRVQFWVRRPESAGSTSGAPPPFP